MALDTLTRQRLLVLARTALHARVRREPPPPIPDDLVIAAYGVFVTLRVGGDLRGCLGSLACREPIASEIARLAALVACEDYRFTPLGRHELGGTSLDLSILAVPEPVIDHLAIEIGRHGLIVEHGRHRGLLLPQVPIEHGWDRETFLNHICLKAGLPSNAWRNGATLFRFEAEVFGE